MKIKKFLFLLLLMYPAVLMAQQVSQNKKEVVDYDKPRKYVIGGIDVEGVKHIGHKQIISLTGLTVGSEITIPSEATSAVIEKLWQQRYFSSVSLEIDSLSAARDTVYLVLNLQERPRVSRWAFKGIKNSEQNDLQDRLNLRR